MAQRRSRSSRVTERLADMSGLSDAEMKVMLGATLAVGSIAVALRTFQILDDLGLIHSSHRDAPVDVARLASLSFSSAPV